MYVDTPERSASTHTHKRGQRGTQRRDRDTRKEGVQSSDLSIRFLPSTPLSAVKMASLRNRFFVLRHGQSLGNVAKTIVSDPKNGCSDYGLSDIGKEQACQVMQTIRQMI